MIFLDVVRSVGGEPRFNLSVSMVILIPNNTTDVSVVSCGSVLMHAISPEVYNEL